MWKLAIKNLWSRRRRNSWLFAELIVVTVITFALTDPIMVVTHDMNLPAGYDIDRLCIIDVAQIGRQAAAFDSTATDSAQLLDNCLRIVDRVRALPEIEKATPSFEQILNDDGLVSQGLLTADSTYISCPIIRIVARQQALATYGFKAAEGSPSIDELDNMPLAGTAIIDDEVRRAGIIDSTIGHPAGVIENARYRMTQRNPYLIIRATSVPVGSFADAGGFRILARLRPGITPDEFVRRIKPDINKTLAAGNFFGRDVRPYTEHNAKTDYATAGAARQLKLILAAFFLVNLCLGATGTFWFQTRKRTHEAGIHRSYGASASTVRRMIRTEGVILASVAWLIGAILFLQYAMKEGLDNGNNWDVTEFGLWIENFWLHFGALAAVTYAIIIVIVLLGIEIPARRFSRIRPVDALRAE